MQTPKKRSPYGLIQEELRDRPWRLLIACMMLNLTNIKQVRPVITQFFLQYPDAFAAANASHDEMASIIKPLGLYNRRTKNIIKFSYAWAFDDFDPQKIEKLTGIGKYAVDSYNIFVNGSLDVTPSDLKLKKYLEWAKRQYNEKCS